MQNKYVFLTVITTFLIKTTLLKSPLLESPLLKLPLLELSLLEVSLLELVLLELNLSLHVLLFSRCSEFLTTQDHYFYITAFQILYI